MMDSPEATRLLKCILDRKARVGVIGLGDVGLPLAVELAGAGFTVTAIDSDVSRVQAVNAGRSYLPEVLASNVARLRHSRKLRATDDRGALGDLDAVTVCAPAGGGGSSFVAEAVAHIASSLHVGMLIVIESEVFLKAMDTIVLPVFEATGLRVGRDYFLAASPERIDRGNPFFNIRNVPKVIGGITRDCTRLASALYGAAVDSIVSVSSARAAEMVQAFETMFRTVNGAMVNELALACDRMNLDVWEVINAARTKPFGFMPFYPGLGERFDESVAHTGPAAATPGGYASPFMDLAAQVDAGMPRAVLELVGDALNTQSRAVRGSSVLMAGVACGRGLDGLGGSPALDIMNALASKGAVLAYTDPLIPVLPGTAWLGGIELRSIPLTPHAIGQADCVVLLVDHGALDTDTIVEHARLVVDVRNATGGGRNVFRLGAPRPSSPPLERQPVASVTRLPVHRAGRLRALGNRRHITVCK